jgi:hypothetical protein
LIIRKIDMPMNSGIAIFFRSIGYGIPLSKVTVRKNAGVKG